MLLGLALLAPPTFAASDTGTIPTGGTDTDTTCTEEGGPCTTEDGAEGECDADLTCIPDDEPSGCSTVGGAGGFGLVVAAGLLGLRFRK